MRRFLIRNAAGEQVGEGVEWADRTVTARQQPSRGVDFASSASELALAYSGIGLSIDWLDPEPADRSRDGDGGVIGIAAFRAGIGYAARRLAETHDMYLERGESHLRNHVIDDLSDDAIRVELAKS